MLSCLLGFIVGVVMMAGLFLFFSLVARYLDNKENW